MDIKEAVKTLQFSPLMMCLIEAVLRSGNKNMIEDIIKLVAAIQTTIDYIKELGVLGEE